MNLEILRHAKNYIGEMANGINPLTKKSVPADDIINNVRISRCLFYVSEILEEVLLNGGIYNSAAKKFSFNLSRETLSQFDYSDDALSISKIVKRINDLKPNECMANLKVVDICKWLVSIGLLVEIEDNGKKIKRPTEAGEKIGLFVQHRVYPHHEYDIVLYKRSAQEFIITNFRSLLEYINYIVQ